MALTSEQWHQLANGGIDLPIRAFALDPVLSVRLGVGTVSVWIRPDYVQKIRFKHDTAPELFEHIPSIANTGEAFMDKQRPFALNFFGNIDGRMHKLVLKGIPDVNEIWIVTFHPVRQEEYERQIRSLNRVRKL